MGQHHAVHALHGDQQHDQVALHLADVHAARQQRAALDAQPHGVVQQLVVQGLLHQLQRVP